MENLEQRFSVNDQVSWQGSSGVVRSPITMKQRTLRPPPSSNCWAPIVCLSCGCKSRLVPLRLLRKAINELVDALLEEPEVQAILVPDLVEAEVYRYALHRILCIAQFMLSQLQIRLFGTQVRLGLYADHSQAPGADKKAEDGLPLIAVREKDVQSVLARIEDEQLRIERELGLRRGDVHLRRSSLDGPALVTHVDLGETEDVHEFTTMAAQDRLSRSLAIQRNVSVPIEIAFQMVSDVNAYPQWMPFCTSAFVTSKEEVEGPGGSSSAKLKCDVGFGLDTGTALGAVGDTIKYQVSLLPPTSDSAAIAQVYHQEPGDVRRVARVVADTVDGFRYGRRLVYDRPSDPVEFLQDITHGHDTRMPRVQSS